MKKYWLIFVFSLFLLSPALSGCSPQQSQDSARDLVEQEDSQYPEADEADDADEAEDADAAEE